MLIDKQTKIAVLLRHHPDALEAIIKLSPDFKKLRNPFLRKLMAGRTSIAMAARMGGCRPEDFFEKLRPLGFELDPQTTGAEDTSGETSIIPAFLKEIKEENLVLLDVRPILSTGKDPLRQIRLHVKELKTGQVLKIINTFEPTPLLRLLEKQGLKSHVDVLGKDLVETYFYKSEDAIAPRLEADSATSDDWNDVVAGFREGLQFVDVRHLEMPMPMMTILETLEKLPSGSALYVHHKRIPVFLLTELKDRGFDYRIRAISDQEVHLIIFRNRHV